MKSYGIRIARKVCQVFSLILPTLNVRFCVGAYFYGAEIIPCQFKESVLHLEFNAAIALPFLSHIIPSHHTFHPILRVYSCSEYATSLKFASVCALSISLAQLNIPNLVYIYIYYEPMALYIFASPNILPIPVQTPGRALKSRPANAPNYCEVTFILEHAHTYDEK